LRLATPLRPLPLDEDNKVAVIAFHQKNYIADISRSSEAEGSSSFLIPSSLLFILSCGANGLILK
jgi:hypothetical protein